MEKQEELEKAVLYIGSCGEYLVAISKRLTELFGITLQEPDTDSVARNGIPPEETPKGNASPPSLEDVRSVLAQKSVDGFTEEVRVLIGKYGANKLSDVPSEKYDDLLKEAEGIGNGT